MHLHAVLHNFQDLRDILCDCGLVDEDVGERVVMIRILVKMIIYTYNKPINSFADAIFRADEDRNEE